MLYVLRVGLVYLGISKVGFLLVRQKESDAKNLSDTITSTILLLLVLKTTSTKDTKPSEIYLSLELSIVRHAQSRAKFASARNTKPGNPIITIKGWFTMTPKRKSSKFAHP